MWNTCVSTNKSFIFMIISYGPLRHHWCMRYESKNAQMKSFVTNCFKNVALSVAIRHQQWLCYQLLVHPSQSISGFLYKGDQVSSGALYYNLIIIPFFEHCLLKIHVVQSYNLSISPYCDEIQLMFGCLPNTAFWYSYINLSV